MRTFLGRFYYWPWQQLLHQCRKGVDYVIIMTQLSITSNGIFASLLSTLWSFCTAPVFQILLVVTFCRPKEHCRGTFGCYLLIFILLLLLLQLKSSSCQFFLFRRMVVDTSAVLPSPIVALSIDSEWIHAIKKDV